MIDLFGFSAGAWRLPNSALRASPKILLFALSELKNCRRPKRPKRHRRRSLETAPGGFGQEDLIVKRVGAEVSLSDHGSLVIASLRTLKL